MWLLHALDILPTVTLPECEGHVLLRADYLLLVESEHAITRMLALKVVGQDSRRATSDELLDLDGVQLHL